MQKLKGTPASETPSRHVDSPSNQTKAKKTGPPVSRSKPRCYSILHTVNSIENEGPGSW